MSKNVQVKFIRTHDTGAKYYPKDTVTELPEAEAKVLAAGKKPAVQILKEKV